MVIGEGTDFKTSKQLQLPENVTALQILFERPELNPMENVSQYLKIRFCSNRAYADYEELAEASINASQAAVTPKLI